VDNCLLVCSDKSFPGRPGPAAAGAHNVAVGKALKPFVYGVLACLFWQRATDAGPGICSGKSQYRSR